MENQKIRIHQDVYISAVLLVFSAYVFYLTSKMKEQAARFPRIALTVFVILIIWVLLDGIRKSVRMTSGKDISDQRLLIWAQNRMPYALFLITVLYAVLMKYIGFFVSTALFMPAVMLFFRNRNIKMIIGVTGGTLIFVYILFVQMLHAQLP